MTKFNLTLTIGLLHFVVFSFLLLKHYKKDTPKSQGIVFSSIFGFGMSVVYLIEVFNI